MTVTSLSPTKAELDRIVEEHLRLEHEENLDALMATLSDDVEHDIIGHDDNPMRGHQQVSARYREHFRAYRHIRDVPVRRLYGHDFVIDESICMVRVTGKFEGKRLRAKPARYRVLHIFEVRDGKVVREQVWPDLHTLRNQLLSDTDVPLEEPVGAQTDLTRVPAPASNPSGRNPFTDVPAPGGAQMVRST